MSSSITTQDYNQVGSPRSTSLPMAGMRLEPVSRQDFLALVEELDLRSQASHLSPADLVFLKLEADYALLLAVKIHSKKALRDSRPKVHRVMSRINELQCRDKPYLVHRQAREPQLDARVWDQHNATVKPRRRRDFVFRRRHR